LSESTRPSTQGAGSKQTVAPSAAQRLPASRRRWRIAGYTAGVIVCLLFMALGTVFGHFYWNSPLFREMWHQHGISSLVNVVRTGDPLADWRPERQFPDRTSLNVLVIGVDHDYDNRGQIVKTTPGRSDSILLARVDFVRNTISALTIPRDTAVRIPGRHGISKINAAHSHGGPDLLIETIRTVFGIPVDAWVSINFEGFQKVVDALGGVYINVEKKLDYDDNWGKLHIHLKPGYQHLTGYEAMGYVRMRHSDSDLMRSRRQHAFLEALRTKLKQPATFLRLPQVINQLNDALKRGGITNDQMFALANFARQLPRENIAIETLPSYEGPSYVTVDTEKSAEVIQRLFYPDQQVALQIEAPDPNSVRALNMRYDRRSRRAPRRGRPAPAAAPTPTATAPAPPAEPADLSVEEPSAEQQPAPEPQPEPQDGDPESGAGTAG